MELTPDAIVYWRWGPLELNATVLFGWLVTALLVSAAALTARRLSSGRDVGRAQLAMEAVVAFLRRQIRDVIGRDPAPYLPFVGTLFLFIALGNALTVVPWFEPPTGSLSTTAALALCVFFAVPWFGVRELGLLPYLRSYLEPNVFMLPFNVIGELSRTLALAVRLFGNIMSGTVIVAILLSIAPLFFPVVMRAFGLLIGIIQAYIFAVLAIVYIASGTEVRERRRDEGEDGGGTGGNGGGNGGGDDGGGTDDEHDDGAAPADGPARRDRRDGDASSNRNDDPAIRGARSASSARRKENRWTTSA